MSGTHGDLFSEIGKIVLAAHTGAPIDLKAKSEDLASRYWNLGLPADTMAKALARSIGAIGVSMAVVSHKNGGANGHSGAEANGHEGAASAANGNGHAAANGSGHHPVEAMIPGAVGEPIKLKGDRNLTEPTNGHAFESPAKSAAALFPSGIRLAVLS